MCDPCGVDFFCDPLLLGYFSDIVFERDPCPALLGAVRRAGLEVYSGVRLSKEPSGILLGRKDLLMARS